MVRVVILLGPPAIDLSVFHVTPAPILFVADGAGRFLGVFQGDHPLENAELLQRQVRASDDPERRL